MHALLIVLTAGLVAGAMNAMAGGGSFISVPALIYVGVPSVSANMSRHGLLYIRAVSRVRGRIGEISKRYGMSQ